MKLRAEIAAQTYHVQLPGVDISIPLQFDGPQPNTYHVAAAHSEAYRSGGWVGDVREGGSCNFETVSITPHCNGTHTECIGHITAARMHIVAQLQETLIPATVLTVTPIRASETQDSYFPALAENDLLIDKALLEAAMPLLASDFRQAIVIRSLPNHPEKAKRDYMQDTPAFFSLEAMHYLVGLGMQHLLTDLPSVDRLFDEGQLRSHRIFWNIAPGKQVAEPESRINATITEMIYVPDHVPDGGYLLSLQVAPFRLDAAPSRPILYSLSQD
jgi:kynurenine formamidase